MRQRNRQRSAIGYEENERDERRAMPREVVSILQSRRHSNQPEAEHILTSFRARIITIHDKQQKMVIGREKERPAVSVQAFKFWPLERHCRAPMEARHEANP